MGDPNFGACYRMESFDDLLEYAQLNGWVYFQLTVPHWFKFITQTGRVIFVKTREDDLNSLYDIINGQ